MAWLGKINTMNLDWSRFYKGFISLAPEWNPYFSLGMAFSLVYVPHAMKIGCLVQKLEDEGRSIDIRESRAASDKAISENSPLGKFMAACHGCHQNGWEALIYFSISVLSALTTNVDSRVIAQAGAQFVLLRAAFTGVYLSPLNGWLRTAFWTLGVLTSQGLLVEAYKKSVAK
eukprot:gene4454-4879_t